jgi:5,10-methylenetetrahydromethanopterin reductase
VVRDRARSAKMPGMRLGSISLWGEDVDDFRREIRLAEELGYDVIGIGDSPAAWQDAVASLTVAALETTKPTLATAVTTPFLRHPLALARSMLSVAQLAGGDRVVVGFGGGGSAPAGLGRTGGSLKEVREYVLALRALLNGESITWEGYTTAPLANARPLRIFIAADGPRQQALAGEIADGVIVNLGMSMDIVDQRLENVRAGAGAAGRDPDDVEIWGYTYASVRDRREDAIADIAAFLAIMGALWTRRPYARARRQDPGDAEALRSERARGRRRADGSNGRGARTDGLSRRPVRRRRHPR